MYPDHYDYTLVQSRPAAEQAFRDLLACVIRYNMLALDTETSGLHAKQAHLVLLTLATPEHAYVFDPAYLTPSITSLLRQEMGFWRLAHAAMFDWGFVAQHLGIHMSQMLDTRRAQHACGHRSNDSLARAVRQWLDLELDKGQQLRYVGQSPPFVLDPQAVRYAALDALVLWPLFVAMSVNGITQTDLRVTDEDLLPIVAYITANAPWPTTREYPSLTHKEGVIP